MLSKEYKKVNQVKKRKIILDEKNYSTDFMFHMVVVCVTYSYITLSLVIFNFPLVFNLQL